MGTSVSVPDRGVTVDEAKALVPEGRWQLSFDARFAAAAPKPLPKAVALEAWAKAERRRTRFEGDGCVAANRFREYECPETGGHYVVDRATGSSRWADDGAGAGAPPAFSRERCEDTGHVYYHNKDKNLSHWETPRWDHVAEAKGPAAEWREAFDDYHQQTYFLNTATGEARWDLPEAAGA